MVRIDGRHSLDWTALDAFREGINIDISSFEEEDDGVGWYRSKVRVWMKGHGRTSSMGQNENMIVPSSVRERYKKQLAWIRRQNLP